MSLLNNLGRTANVRGDYAEAKRWLQEAFVFLKETNETPLLIENLSHQETAAYLEGAYTEAKQRYLESIELSQETGQRWQAGHALIGLGYTTCALGEFEASGRYLRAALQTAMEIESLWMAMDTLAGLARLLTAGDPGGSGRTGRRTACVRPSASRRQPRDQRSGRTSFDRVGRSAVACGSVGSKRAWPGA